MKPEVYVVVRDTNKRGKTIPKRAWTGAVYTNREYALHKMHEHRRALAKYSKRDASTVHMIATRNPEKL